MHIFRYLVMQWDMLRWWIGHDNFQSIKFQFQTLIYTQWKIMRGLNQNIYTLDISPKALWIHQWINLTALSLTWNCFSLFEFFHWRICVKFCNTMTSFWQTKTGWKWWRGFKDLAVQICDGNILSLKCFLWAPPSIDFYFCYVPL